jgi:hypothetical protein
LSAADFVAACSRPDPDWISFCHGYVQAVYDGPRRPGEDFCIPAGTTRATIVGAAVSQMTGMRDAKSVNAASVVYAALLKTFPCR